MAKLENIKTPLFHIFEISKQEPDITYDKIESCLIHVGNIYNTDMVVEPTCVKQVDSIGVIKLSVPKYEQQVKEEWSIKYNGPTPHTRWTEIVMNQITGKKNYFITTTKGRGVDTFGEDIRIGPTRRYSVDDGGLISGVEPNNVTGFAPHFHGWLTKIDSDPESLSWDLEFTDIVGVLKNHLADDPFPYNEAHKRTQSRNIITQNNKPSTNKQTLIDLTRGAIAYNFLRNGLSMFNNLTSTSTDFSKINWSNYKPEIATIVHALAPTPHIRAVFDYDGVSDISLNIQKGCSAYELLSIVHSSLDLNICFDIVIIEFTSGKYIIRPDFTPYNVEVDRKQSLFKSNMSYDLHSGYTNVQQMMDFEDDDSTSWFVGGYVNTLEQSIISRSVDPYPICKLHTERIDKDSFTDASRAGQAMLYMLGDKLKATRPKKMNMIYSPTENTDRQVFILGDTIKLNVPELWKTFEYQVTSVGLTFDAETLTEVWDYGCSIKS